MAAATNKSHRAEVPPPLFNPQTALKLVQQLWDWDHALQMFHFPVSEVDVPGYSKVIQTPIDLSTIKRRIEASTSIQAASSSSVQQQSNVKPYTTLDEVVEDIYLMTENALIFNEKGSVWFKHAKQLKKILPSMLKKLGIIFDAKNKDEDEGDDGVYLPTQKAKDSEKSLLKEEKRNKENVGSVLKSMEEDLDIPIDVLRAKYQQQQQKVGGASPSGSKNQGSAATTQQKVEKPANDDAHSSLSSSITTSSSSQSSSSGSGSSSSRSSSEESSCVESDDEQE